MQVQGFTRITNLVNILKNYPNRFFLPENDWEVALASISLPDMAPQVNKFIATRRPILAQAMFFSKT